MDRDVSAMLIGSEIHGFHTMKDLDVPAMMEEAKTRWLRPNEIHAILRNYKYFTVNVKPVNLPKSGTIVLFDRKMLRNFRKDGHNWKKKKDGKTVKEAHEHLKVGDEERIHVYYAHGEDNPTFVRRCYWLLDKTLEQIVLVHYRETQEGSPSMPVNSSSISDHSGPSLVAEDTDSQVDTEHHPRPKGSLGRHDSLNVRSHEMRLHEINTLEWDELLASSDFNDTAPPTVENTSYSNSEHQTSVNGSLENGKGFPANRITNTSPYGNLREPSNNQNSNLVAPGSVYIQSTGLEVKPNFHSMDINALGGSEFQESFVNDGLQCQDSFGMWINSIITDSPGSVDDHFIEGAVSPVQDSYASSTASHHQSLMPEQVFTITDISPAWAYSTENTKILVTGFFHEGYQHLAKSDLVCVCGDLCLPAEFIQVGVYRCFLSPHSPGIVSLYLSSDGNKPISQVLNFEFRTALSPQQVVSKEENSEWEEFQLQLSLAHLLFSASKNFNFLCGKVSPAILLEAKKFANRATYLSTSWAYLMKSVQENQVPFDQAKENFLELILKNRLREWLLEKMLEGGKTTEYNATGQGVIHLCAILGYTWAIHMFSWSGLSLNFRDKYGWTALHWAAYCGREKMVATLLSAGARPNLVTDPTKEDLGGCTAADLASKKGFEGLAAYLSEKSLVAHFEDMKIAGNISGELQTSTTDNTIPENLSEEEHNLKDTLAAYRTAAEAASRIQVAFREHSFKLRSEAIRVASPEEEARNIIAAMRIQHAFRNFENRKKMAAAARIQQRFLTWKMRREFLKIRRHALKIQAVFRGFQVRKQYRKIVWSVGVVEKAVLRWRLKRKGLRGLQLNPIEAAASQNQGSETEEDFYKTSRRQAEDRLGRSVITIQSMFRSKKAQQEYRRMKLAHQEAIVEYKGLQDRDNAMES